MTKNRYYQPKNTKDALRFIEKLFNKYRNAPITKPLMQYHQKLMNQIRTNLIPMARQEQAPQRVKAAQNMYRIMKLWITIRLAGQPFPHKLRDFKISTDQPKFKAHHVRIKGQNHLRASRH